MRSPSDLPWWGWMLCGVGGFIVAALAIGLSDDSDGGCLAKLFGFIVGLASLVCGAIGIIRFIKWVWGIREYGRRREYEGRCRPGEEVQ